MTHTFATNKISLWNITTMSAILIVFSIYFPASIYLFTVNNVNFRTMCEIFSKLTTKTPELPQWRLFSAFVVNFEQISLVALFPLLTLNKLIMARFHESPNSYHQNKCSKLVIRVFRPFRKEDVNVNVHQTFIPKAPEFLNALFNI